MQQLEEGSEPFCPVVYKVWARGLHGFAVAAEWARKYSALFEYIAPRWASSGGFRDMI